jgi:argininosuccinate lyase
MEAFGKENVAEEMHLLCESQLKLASRLGQICGKLNSFRDSRNSEILTSISGIQCDGGENLKASAKRARA